MAGDRTVAVGQPSPSREPDRERSLATDSSLRPEDGRPPARFATRPALGVGVLIGCSPFYGFHLLLGRGPSGGCSRLNRLKMYLAANISNPLFSPLLILAEIQAGAWARRQDFHDLSLAEMRTTSAWVYGGDLLLGSLIVGTLARPGGRGGYLRHAAPRDTPIPSRRSGRRPAIPIFRSVSRRGSSRAGSFAAIRSIAPRRPRGFCRTARRSSTSAAARA